MKRVNQPHNTNVHTSESFVTPGYNTEQNGVDTPAEKEISKTDTGDVPDMGALPVDSMGSGKSSTEWTGSTVDEAHVSDEDEDTPDDEIVAVGTGPDPEHTDR